MLNDIHNDLKQLITALTSFEVCIESVLATRVLVRELNRSVRYEFLCIYRRMKRDFECANDFVYRTSSIIATSLSIAM